MKWLHEGEPLEAFFADSWARFVDKDLWVHMPETEEWRSQLLRMMMRPAACVFQLVKITTQGFPYRLAALVVGSLTAEEADKILKTPKCLLDRFSRDFLARFASVQQLQSEEAKQMMTLVSHMALCCTYTTERLHSCNLRRTQTRVSNKACLQHVALSHMGRVAPKWSTVSSKVVRIPGRRPGRPAKVKNEKVRKGKAGGGGAWRAFCSARMSGGKVRGADGMKALAEEYKQLSGDDKAHFLQMGSAGSTRLYVGLG